MHGLTGRRPENAATARAGARIASRSAAAGDKLYTSIYVYIYLSRMQFKYVSIYMHGLTGRRPESAATARAGARIASRSAAAGADFAADSIWPRTSASVEEEKQVGLTLNPKGFNLAADQRICSEEEGTVKGSAEDDAPRLTMSVLRGSAEVNHICRYVYMYVYIDLYMYKEG